LGQNSQNEKEKRLEILVFFGEDSTRKKEKNQISILGFDCVAINKYRKVD
jgi:hypothetical protein